METKEMICIVCPKGCRMQVNVDNQDIMVTGNGCKRGIEYARTEIFAATRMLTTTVLVEDRKYMLSVRTKSPIPKDKIFSCMQELRNVTVKAPINIGDVVLSNVDGTGVDIIASSYMG